MKFFISLKSNSSIATSQKHYLKLLHGCAMCNFKNPYLMKRQKSISGNITVFLWNRQIFGQSSCFSCIFIGMCFDSQTEIPDYDSRARKKLYKQLKHAFIWFVCFPVCKSTWTYRFVCQQALRIFDRLLLHTVIIHFTKLLSSFSRSSVFIKEIFFSIVLDCESRT